MPSKLSEILMGYKKTLDVSQADYEAEFNRRVENLTKYYSDWFSKLIRPYDLKDAFTLSKLKKMIKRLSGDDELPFAAVDGTCWKKDMEPYVVFFSAAYAVRGTIKIEDNPPKVRYERWHPDQDTSIVAYVPVPYALLSDVEKDESISQDSQRINLSSVHTNLMTLAEIYLMIDILRSSVGRPKFLLWDQSMSSMFLKTTIQGTINEINRVSFFGKSISGIEVRKGDAWVVFSHPYLTKFKVPSRQHENVWRYVIQRLYTNRTEPLLIQEILDETGIKSEKNLRERCKEQLLGYAYDDALKSDPIVEWNSVAGTITLKPEYYDSWERCLRFLEFHAQRMYKGKEENPMTYTYVKDGEIRRRYFSVDDIRFLTAIAIRVLVEKCYENQIMLVGISKDSSINPFTNRYLGSLGKRDNPPFGCYETIDPQKPIPWSDRLCLEALPVIDTEIAAPWSTIEFDSVFLSLSYSYDQKESQEMKQDRFRLRGIRGYSIDPPERLFLRSLAQFFLKRDKEYPTQGHVIFIDRLAHPKFDTANPTYTLDGSIWRDDRWGLLEPFWFRDNSVENDTQSMVMYLLSVLTKNLFPEVIGYPDPLHKADWGAKSLLRKVQPMILSSEFQTKRDPLKNTFRKLRESVKR